MTSFETAPHLNGTADSLESDYSIIPEIPIMNVDIEANGSISMGLRSAMLSATPDLSLEELRSRLIDVCEDNASLKEKVKYSNEMMDRNLKTIKEWHNRMTDSMCQQQIELKEANEKVARLEKENAELHAKVKELQSRSKDVVDCATSVKDDVPLSDEEVDFEIVNRKKLQKKGDDQETEKAEEKIASLMKKLEYKEEMFAELERQYSDEAIKNRFLELPGELLEFIEKLSDLGSTLIYENFQPQENDNKKHYSEVIKLYRERLSFYRILCCKVFKQMKEKMDEMEQSLKLARSDLEEEKAKHSDTQKIYQQVQTNYDRVTKLLQIESKEKREKSFVSSKEEMDTKMHLEQLDKVSAQLFENEQKLISTEKKLLKKEKEVEDLSLELNKLKKDVEAVPLLQSQLSTYEADLNSAMLARDAAQEDINRLTLQLAELSSVTCSNCGASLSSGEAGGRRKGKRSVSDSTKRNDDAKPNEVLVCPICSRGYSHLEELEKHVDECLSTSEID